ncbi:MAG: response regulator [Flavobacterium sp.]|nr:response regulator [Candidatus Neoflavobacterium equi]
MFKNKLSHIPIKFILGYIILLAIAVAAGFVLYTENALFYKMDHTKTVENNKVILLSTLISNISKVERVSRSTVYSENPTDFSDYVKTTDTLIDNISRIKAQLQDYEDVYLLDNIKDLLRQKTENIITLQNIRNKQSLEKDVTTAITNMQKLEEHYRKLKVEDFVKTPNDLGDYQRKVLHDYVSYLNQNIPDDTTNTISQKKMDSILVTSKNLLLKVLKSNEEKRKAYEAEEKKLLKNENVISEKIASIIHTVEETIKQSSVAEQLLKQDRLKSTNQKISYFALLTFGFSIFFLILVISDFSKSQTYKKQLERANKTAQSLLKSREQLISTVSHDLKTPISSISGYGEILGKTDLSNKQAYYIQNIVKSAEYLGNLANDLSSLTQIEAGKIKLEKSPFVLNTLLKETAQNVQSIYPNKNLDLRFELDPSLDQVIASDPYRIRQITTNLVGNAYKFTQSGSITISSQRLDAHTLAFHVTDTGIGIKKENQDLIFQEFTQADHTIEKRFGGTGLGLTISRKLAEILGGSIALESEYGKGSTFSVRIGYEDLAGNRSTTEVPTTVDLSHKTALLVDDDQQLLSLIHEVLTKAGVKAISCQSVEEVLQRIPTSNPDFILTDIQMPVQDGFDLVRAVKGNPATAHITVIALTGNSDATNINYQQAGFNGLLSKPFSINTLKEIIGKILEHPQQFVANNKHFEFKADQYNLDSINAFLNNDVQAIREFMEQLAQTNTQNLGLLQEHIAQKDTEALQKLTHKMSSIFKQVEHREITQLLKDMEQSKYPKVWEIKYQKLAAANTAFFKAVLG